MQLKDKWQRELLKYNSEEKRNTRHAITRIRMNQNENEEQKNVWLQDMQRQNKELFSKKNNQQWELQFNSIY